MYFFFFNSCFVMFLYKFVTVPVYVPQLYGCYDIIAKCLGSNHMQSLIHYEAEGEQRKFKKNSTSDLKHTHILTLKY